MNFNKIMDLKGIIAALLKCDIAEVELIENCRYDFNDIIKSLEAYGCDSVTLPQVVSEIYDMGISSIQNAVEKEHMAVLQEIEGMKNGACDCETEKAKIRKLNKISSLNPEEDIKLYYNSVATRISIPDDELLDIYNEYFKDVLEQAGKDMGIEIE